jgi:hypothetical protein
MIKPQSMKSAACSMLESLALNQIYALATAEKLHAFYPKPGWSIDGY